MRIARRYRLQHRNIEGISPMVDGVPVDVDNGLVAFEQQALVHSGLDIGLPTHEQALVHSGLDIDLLTYEQVLVQDGRERGHHFWIRPTRQFLLRLNWYNWQSFSC